MPDSRVAEYPRPDHVLFHFSDTHLIAGTGGLYGAVDAELRLRELLARAEASGITPTALVFTGDLTDRGEPGAYDKLRALVTPVAQRLGSPVVWVPGNHDSRATLREHLLDEADTTEPLDRVHVFDGLRIVVLDTTVPGKHYGALSDSQLSWLATALDEPAPFGTILALHHPPVPCIQDLAVTVELRDQRRLAEVLAGTDVRSILAGHLHFSSTATFAGIPVSVASSACYSQDLAVAVGGQRGHDGAQSFNFVHIYPGTVVHSVVPIEAGPTVGQPATPAEAARRLADENIVILPAGRIPHVLPQPPAAPEPGDTASGQAAPDSSAASGSGSALRSQGAASGK